MKLYPLIIAGILGAATASQGTVTITNAGFEDPAHTANDGTNPTGWTVFESALGGSPDKQIRTRNNFKNTGAMGVQVGAGNSNHDGELYQTVATVIGQEYTFSIYAAATSGAASPATQNFTVELLAGTAVAGAPATGASLSGNSLSQLTTVSDGYPGLTDTDSTLDFDGGSLETGIEYVLDSDPTDASDDLTVAPTSTYTGTALEFDYRRSDVANDDPSIIIAVEYNSDLSGSDLSGWTTAEHGIAGVTIAETDDFDTGIDRVVVSLPIGLGVEGKLFARLNVTMVP